MGFVLGHIVRALLPGKKPKIQQVKKIPEGAITRKYIKKATALIKNAVKEPNELPVRENVPAIRELFENSIETP